MKPGLIHFQRTFSTENRRHQFLFKQRWSDGYKSYEWLDKQALDHQSVKVLSPKETL